MLDAARHPRFYPGVATPGPGVRARLVQRFFGRLRFPWAFVAFALLLALDLALPDVIPFLDEAILALGTALFGMWRQRKTLANGRAAAGGPTPLPPAH